MAASDNLILYADKQLASPYAMSVAVALAEKGVSYELRRLDLNAKEHQDAGYRARSLALERR